MRVFDLEYLNSLSPDYIESLYEVYKNNPSKLSYKWRLFFDGLSVGAITGGGDFEGQEGTKNGFSFDSSHSSPSRTSSLRKTPIQTPIQHKKTEIELRILDLIEAYRQRGHLLSHLDPLDLLQRAKAQEVRLDLASFGLDQVSSHETFQVSSVLGLSPCSLPEILSHLKKTYSSSIAVEYMHISDIKAREWLEKRMEPSGNKSLFSKGEKKRFLKHLIKATQFETFLQKNFTGQKRFSLEGAEALLPAIKQIILIASQRACFEIVFGMSHRGRINLLANVLRKPFKDIFREFEGYELPQGHFLGLGGDVKYHLGYSNDVQVNGKTLHMSMAFNPSHLESIGPVVQGMVRAKQDQLYLGDPQSVVPILIHGDAAVVGQGVVMETLNLSSLEGYSTGGTLHLVVNNQIGFTTLPEEGRSTPYSTSFAKAIEAPIFHVNGFDLESVLHVASLAIDFRMTFHRDVFIDLYCYRKYGHNEGDEPRFTQPLMYKKIEKSGSLSDVYRTSLISEGLMTKEEVSEISENFYSQLSGFLAEVRKEPKAHSFTPFSVYNRWKGIEVGGEENMTSFVNTSIQSKHLDQVLDLIYTIPESIKVMKKFERMILEKKKKIQEKDIFDWATAEQLAFGSLLIEGYGIRLSGQDSVRGTFSQRHLSLVDSETEEKHFPLKHLASLVNEPLKKKSSSKVNSFNSDSDSREFQSVFFEAFNSPLSEYAVMGFDFGYSSVFPNTLTLWEGQFGDFSNGAQVIIDQFLSGSQEKWGRLNSLVLLLPHGYEGQGPEHSSARLERFLQLCGKANMIVAYPTTPAQYCHLLRRQMHSSFRKPLIVMTPKSPLRRPDVVSKKRDFLKGGFNTFLESGAPPKKCRRLIFCTGKVYWDLKKRVEGKSLDLEETSFIRIEQLYPFDSKELSRRLKEYKKSPLLLWVQEEPENMGAWNFVRSEIWKLGLNLKYVGRKASAGVATGLPIIHKEEEEKLMKEAFASLKEERKEA